MIITFHMAAIKRRPCHALGVVRSNQREGSVTEKAVTALCVAIILASLFGGPMAGKGGRFPGDAGKVASLGR
jgi:hypothetical protein